MEEDDVHDYQEEEEGYVNDDGDPADEFDFNEDARFSFADNHFDEDIKDNAPELHEKYKVVVGKVRTIVRFFKRSPVKNDLLQSYVKAECSKERKLLLDCKTRWSNLSDMLDRFYELRKPVKKALVDLDGGDKLDLDEMEMELVCLRVWNQLKMMSNVNSLHRKSHKQQVLINKKTKSVRDQSFTKSLIVQ
ncbi:hypothetical protein Bhyg_09643 [Pseudolycoriella hygida]|uniref:Uncharacterized protein n=1 Tax=Pseudolycoriella hygida TaxID=35572 RepID=A0A9Q0N731_9DIPT|nr:hypothetical protein Bhyg_09643 [Pseudolycoriella hygida]